MSTSPAPDDRWLVLKFGGTSVSKRGRWDNIGRLAEGRARAVLSSQSGFHERIQGGADFLERLLRDEGVSFPGRQDVEDQHRPRL